MGELGTVSPAISLEGFETETDARRGKGVYKKILQAFESLRRHGVPFGVSVTPTRENWDVITSDEFIDFCFEQEGAVYCWSFQYMPIGSSPELDLMLTPEQRFELLKRTHHLIFDKQVLFADFWNSGIASYGCISAGRADGHFHIDWNGDITPCVFVPYAVDNIYSIYDRGGNLESIQEAPFFKRIQSWQDEYGFKQSAEGVHNWLCPCPMRDHFSTLRQAALETGARPLNRAAADALSNPGYQRALEAYADRYKQMSAPVWDDQFAERTVSKK
jgi:MoaA/NifB/PqqE/SkfB family radical SAM enzyme